jgi:hypothetical protein
MKTKIQVGRHQRDCRICNHAQREEIEDAFLSWESPSRIARTYRLGLRGLYRHARALSLFPKRDRNIRAALARVIERGAHVRVTAGAVVQACAVFAKINAAGFWIDRRETVNLNDLFDRMSQAELESYAQKGELPTWFTQTLGGTTVQADGKAGGSE